MSSVVGKKADKALKDWGIKVRKTPEPDRKRTRKPWYRGKRTGLGLYEFLRMLLEANEGRSKSEKMTDAEIARLMIEEFPKSKMAESLRSGKREISLYRSGYNAGKFLGDPLVTSVRYDEEGDPILPKSYKKTDLETARKMYGKVKHKTAWGRPKESKRKKGEEAKESSE